MDKKIVKSYECENMLNSNQQTSSNVIRCPIPTAPVLENCDDAPYSVTILRDPPPYSPPLLSQSNTEPFLTEISQKENGKSRQLRRCDTDVMFKVALFGGIIAAFMLAGGIWCLYDSSPYCPYFSAIWTSIVFIVNALVGIVAAKRCTVNLFVAYLVLSLISVMLCAISATISARNWSLIGTYQHPKIDRNEAFCLIGEYDASRARYILTQMNRYDFKQCLFQLKVGIGINSIQFIIAIIEAVLNFLSSILCCKQICTKCFGT
uniref:Tetraspanin family protein n=1 Tax=Wuchereria bancrofti TaxID=6293 RepID=A0AAF5PS35_WUCBA